MKNDIAFNQLLNQITNQYLEPHPLLMTTQSQKVTDGSIFIAIRGEKIDAHQWIAEIKSRYQVTVVGETNECDIIVPCSRKALAQLSAAYFGYPTKKLKVIGITGTSGKSTTTYIVDSILRISGYRTGLIGTIENRIHDTVIESTHTTPDSFELQKLFRNMVDQSIDAVTMEVSSHALKQWRVYETAFDGMVFLNLSSEHLDYHLTMEDYFESKKLLFTREFEQSQKLGKSPVAVTSESVHQDPLWTQKNIPVFSPIQNVKISFTGVSFMLEGHLIESSLVGEFNIQNIQAAASLLLRMGISLENIQKGIKNLKGVPGRLEKVLNHPNGPNEPLVLVDYAHKPDALEKVLKCLRQLIQTAQNQNQNKDQNSGIKAKLITVFGCGGDRDRLKRPVMGKIACNYSDQVIITSDNPRTEDPQKIIDEIKTGLTGHSYEILVDRTEAIQRAVQSANDHDIILIAGKGHETYQILGSQKIEFDDRKVALAALKQRKLDR